MLGSLKLAGQRAAGLVAAAALAGAAAGCASTATSSAAAASAAAPAATSAAAAPATAAPVSGAPSSAAPSLTPSSDTPAPTPTPTGKMSTSSTAACPTRDLAAKIGIGQGAAGSVYQVIDFTNISRAPCTLYGYPGVSLARGTPVTQVGAAASRSTASTASVVTLAPGATANALLRITTAQNYPSATCAPASTTYLQIYPPDQYTPIYLAYRTTGCAKKAVKLLAISVILAGSGG